MHLPQQVTQRVWLFRFFPWGLLAIVSSLWVGIYGVTKGKARLSDMQIGQQLINQTHGVVTNLNFQPVNSLSFPAIDATFLRYTRYSGIKSIAIGRKNLVFSTESGREGTGGVSLALEKDIRSPYRSAQDYLVPAVDQRVYPRVALSEPSSWRANAQPAYSITIALGLLLVVFLMVLIALLTRRVQLLEAEVRMLTGQRQEMDAQGQERIKELNYLVQVSQLYQQEDLTLSGFLTECVRFLPLAWYSPDLVQARLFFGDQTYLTDSFSPSPLPLRSEITVNQQVRGVIEIHLNQQFLATSSDDFLRGKQAWLDEVAQLLGNLIRHREAESQVRQSEARFRYIASIIADIAYSGVIGADGHLYLDWMTGAIELMTGYTLGEIQSRGSWRFLVVEEDLPLFEDNVVGVLPGDAAVCELRWLRQDGEIIWVASHASCIVSGNGELYLYGGLVDITERKRTEAEIQFLAYYDSLTQLPNRRLFRDRLENSLSLARRKNHYGAVIFVDVDNFKDVNDAWGHTAGDELIQQLAFRLRHSLRQSDTVARFGGDEFIIFLPELADDESEAARLSLYVAEKLQGIFTNPFLVNDYEAMITASIGITLFPKGTGETIDDLIREADMAMYRAKEAGRNVVCLFEGIGN